MARLFPLLGLAAAAAAAYVVDSALPRGRRFDGVGSISGGGATSRLLLDYAPAPRADLLDYLFLPSFGASLHVLKVEIGGEVESTNGAEPSHRRARAGDLSAARGYEWWLMAEARRRNPAIELFALAWGWPGYLRAGSDAKTPWTDRALTADYVVSWVALAASAHNLSIDFVGIWNESGYDLDYISVLREALDAGGFHATKIVAADMYVARWSIADALAANATLRSAVHAVGVHYPGAQSTPAARNLSLPIWSSEDDSGGGQGGAACLARAINENYVNGLMTATITWHAASAFYANIPWFGASLVSAGWPTSGHYEVNHNAWAAAHTAQFSAPGWQYLAHGRGVGYLAGGGTYAALTDGAGNLTIVVEKLDRNASRCAYSASPYNATAPEAAAFELRGDFAGVRELFVWRSSFARAAPAEAFFQPAGAVSPVGGVVTVALAVGDVVTLTTLRSGRHGNHSRPAPAAPFPLPYADGFESRALEAPPALFSDMSGAFEVADASAFGRARALRQATPARPISWQRPDYAPHTIIGDGAGARWADMAANVSVLLSNASHTAALCLRAAQIDQLQGVVFAVNATTWRLFSSLQALAAGGNATAAGPLPARLAVGAWHALALAAEGPNVTARVDGVLVAAVGGFHVGAGWVALATGDYGEDVLFDDFAMDSLVPG